MKNSEEGGRRREGGVGGGKGKGRVKRKYERLSQRYKDN